MKPRTEHTRFGRNHKMGIGSFILLICFYVFVMYFVNPLILIRFYMNKHALARTQTTTTNSRVFKSEEAAEESKSGFI